MQSNNSHLSRSQTRGRMNSPDRTVLIYQDIRLKVSDVETLRPGEWLNDQIISFYFQYLESHIYRHYLHDILLVSTQVTQLMKMTKDHHEDARSILEPLNFRLKQYLFFPLNNNDDERVGGTHWSLMVYSRSENSFYTFDSINKNINDAATKLYHVLKIVLFCPSAQHFCFPSLQQQNNFDCGIHVICNVENIIEHIIRFDSDGKVESVPVLTLDHVLQKRTAILGIIRALGGNI
ncbi:hypothetical protein PVAND_013527 [Polypedilum vanderplanki]|uniref:Ubiquitin-like protease family profile domain-containing protein n=1 Tax=Polypedilum vanderplanki TaxID=319348 RepID=A0A9J6CRV0_POLVA|nr:hypothetical protein PVAND_013527 [Polypedilum vanderplanki]